MKYGNVLTSLKSMKFLIKQKNEFDNAEIES